MAELRALQGHIAHRLSLFMLDYPSVPLPADTPFTAEHLLPIAYAPARPPARRPASADVVHARLVQVRVTARGNWAGRG